MTVLRDGSVVADGPLGSWSTGDLLKAIAGPSAAPAARRRDVDSAVPSRQHTDGDDVVIEVSGLRTSTISGGHGGVDLTVRRGEVLGLAGDQDSGCEAVLPALYGDIPARFASYVVNGVPIPAVSPRRLHEVGMGYLPADRLEGSCLRQLTVRENLTGADLWRIKRGPFISTRRERQFAKRLVELYGVRPPSPEANLESLSGGNQQKVVLARSMSGRCSVLLVHEPTQGLDSMARAHVHELIQQAGRAGSSLVVASSDLETLAEVCTRVLVLHRGRVERELRSPAITAHALREAIVFAAVSTTGEQRGPGR